MTKETKKTTKQNKPAEVKSSNQEVNLNDYVTEEYMTKVLTALGYKKFRAGTEYYFLPQQGKIKFSTKLTLKKAKELFTLN